MKAKRKALTEKKPGLFNPGDFIVFSEKELCMIIEEVQIPDINDRYFKCLFSSDMRVVAFSKYAFYGVVRLSYEI